MRVALEQANVSLGVHAHQQQQQQQQQATAAPPLLSALHPNRQLLVLARGPVLSLLPIQCDDPHPSGSASAADGSTAANAAAAAASHRGRMSRMRSTNSSSGAGGGGGSSSPGGKGSGSSATGSGAGPYYTLRSSQDITSLAWLCVLTGSRQLGAASLTVRPPDLADLFECECLLVGTKDGSLQLHDSSGRLLFKQRLHTGPVEHICVRPCATGKRCRVAVTSLPLRCLEVAS